MKRAIAILFWSAMALAQPEKWPAELAADVQAAHWAAAERVGRALAEEIDAGRMFATFAQVADEARARNLFADALEQNGKPLPARLQRCLARALLAPDLASPCAARASLERGRRVAHLKAEVLAREVKIPASFPVASNGRITVLAFSASWCAPCAAELDRLRRFDHPLAQVVIIDIDLLSAAEKSSFVPMESLLGPEVPRLYVLDRQGNIRFSLVGFEEDGFFTDKLNWMVEAIGGPHQPAECARAGAATQPSSAVK
jgi:thiol-disulfide isomerase/thioredoxin